MKEWIGFGFGFGFRSLSVKYYFHETMERTESRWAESNWMNGICPWYVWGPAWQASSIHRYWYLLPVSQAGRRSVGYLADWLSLSLSSASVVVALRWRSWWLVLLPYRSLGGWVSHGSLYSPVSLACYCMIWYACFRCFLSWRAYHVWLVGWWVWYRYENDWSNVSTIPSRRGNLQS